MATEVYIQGSRLRIDPQKSVGKGGEADIYDIGGGKVLKLFKPPDHPDYDGDPHEQKGAKVRITLHQKKLPLFPKQLPSRVIVPDDIAYDDQHMIVGYTMKFVKGAELLLRYANSDFRKGGITNTMVGKIFTDLHATVGGIHQAGVVIGDFNDLNGLVRGDEVYLIDGDSMQFGQFYCQVFTQKFVDPTLCDPKENKPNLIKPHNANSDWYAFNILLMQSLLFVNPYGGVYLPKDPKKRVAHDSRTMKRITVFDPEVKYPKNMPHFSILSDELLQHFHKVFEKDDRNTFPQSLIQKLTWQVCKKCGIEHARFACPVCAPGVQGIVTQTITIRGKVNATRIFKTMGTILHASYQNSQLKYLYHENGEYKRESGQVILKGGLDPRMRYKIQGNKTLFAKDETVIIFENEAMKQTLTIESTGRVPQVDANEKHYYFIRTGQLMRDGEYGGSEYIGDTLAGQTQFWVGPEFGFGFYWAGLIRIGFVFDASKRGMNDAVKLPPMKGQIIDTHCVFSKSHAWFMWTAQENGVRKNYCTVIRSNGAVEASQEVREGEQSWLSTIHGKCATGPVLLAATDEGIVQLKVDGGNIVEAQKFPDTEPFVDNDSSIFAATQGLYAVRRNEIFLLRIDKP